MTYNKKLTTNLGAPISNNQHSLTAGDRGPTLLQDYALIEKIAHFDRERIPERVVHARGAGAHGVFRLENSMKNYTKAAFLQEAGQETPVFVRFSTVIHAAGSPETARDPRGFAVKFYTSEGNYDIVGNHLPVFFIRDAMKFPDMVHSLKPAPDTNLQDPDRYWDFMSLTPESTHMLTWVFSDYGTPANYRQMEGYSVHAFQWVNEAGEVTYVKYYWRPIQGVRNFTAEELAQVQGQDFNHATRDLFTHIERGDYPAWDLFVQFLNPADVDTLSFDPLDATKLWPEAQFPYHKVGTMILNRNPVNYFAEVEQSAFSPSALVPGIEPSEDKLLQGRLFSYPDTQRHRLGPNYLQIPVNCPYSRVANHQRDGAMQVQADLSPINYEPNRYEHASAVDASASESAAALAGFVTRTRIPKTDDFTQAGVRYQSFAPDLQERLIQNLCRDLASVEPQTKLLAICNFYRADEYLGRALAGQLGVDLTPYVGHPLQAR